jgi:hypothetical protein
MIRRRLPAIALVLLLAAACSPSPGATLTPTSPPGSALASLGPRPSSLATVVILQPAADATITGDTAHVVLQLTGAKIVTTTTTAIRPDEGHVHLYVDNALVSMNYGLEQDIPVTPGTHVLKAEFVAADHAPFSPRVVSAETIFTVH